MVADVICSQCGHQNSVESNFCSSCGAPLQRRENVTTTVNFTPDIEGDDDVAVEFGEVPVGVGVLVVKRGPNVGSRFALDTDYVRAGRHPESDIFLDDITVSRRHAEIRREAEGYVVYDAGSLNGTYLNRERVDRAVLHNGDEVQIGTFKLVFLLGPAGAM
ncbi:MAG: FHA domain-containing protein [Acidimicrobiales bacterium]